MTVQEYIEKREQELLEKEIKAKEYKKKELLLKLGLFEKEYSDKNEYSAEYSSYDNDGYYKKKPFEVTDEEYEKLLSLQNESGGKSSKKNAVATIFYVIASIIFAAGFIAGVVFFSDDSGAGAVTGLLSLFGGFVFGMFFIGFGRIIQLLEDIKSAISDK